MAREKQNSNSGGDQAQPNQIANVENFHGPDLQYSSFAHVTRHPTPQGLDGGRVEFFDITRRADIRHDEAPGLHDADAYEQWLKSQPADAHVARYKDGKLTRYIDDPHVEAIIEEIKDSYADRNMARLDDLVTWRDLPEKSAPDAERARAIEKAARREAGRDRDRDETRER